MGLSTVGCGSRSFWGTIMCLNRGMPLRSMKRMFQATSKRQVGVSMDSIKELRRRTGAPIGAVKKALEAQEGDLEAAIDHLRKLGASLAAKKAHRDASEGLVGIAISTDKTRAAMVELSSETDFVARTPQFQHVLNAITESALAKHSQGESCGVTSVDTEALLTVDENKGIVSNAIASLGENIVLKRAICVGVEKGNGSLHGYIHGKVGEGSGRIGALVALEGLGVGGTGDRLAMHIAAAAPSYLTIESIPATDAERERAILVEAIESESKHDDKPKPPSILHKIVEGRMGKWYSSVVLLEQEMLVEAPSYNDKPRSVRRYVTTETEGAKVLAMARFSVGNK